MIYLVLGENAYQAEQEVRRILRESEGEILRINGEDMTLASLADTMRGNSLFAAKRCIVIRSLSENKEVWEACAQWAPDMNDTTTLILVEPHPDKRTRAYKSLVQVAHVTAVEAWSDRDTFKAEEWLQKLAHQRSVKLTTVQAKDMIARATVPSERAGRATIDQYQLAVALSSLANLDAVTDDAIETVLPAKPGDSAFDLLKLTVARDDTRLRALMQDLRLSANAHHVAQLIFGQWAQLVSLSLAGTTPHTVSELGIHPYVAQKLTELSRQFTREQLATITKLAADIDTRMKVSQFDPWDGIERFVYAIVLR